MFTFAPPFWDTPLYQNFWANLVAGFIVFVIGVPVGLAINRSVVKSGNKERKKQLLHALDGTLAKNESKVSSMVSTKNQSFDMIDNVDLKVFDATSSLKYELIDVGLAKRIDDVHSNLDGISRMIAFILNVLASAITTLRPNTTNSELVFKVSEEMEQEIREVVGPATLLLIADCREEIKKILKS